MAREYARRLVSTWHDKDFRALDLAHQGLYDALCASPDISRTGVIPWIPGRLAQCSDGLKPTVVTRMVKTLTDRGFTHLDVDYAELMVRSHIRHDESLKSPNITRSLVRAYGLVMSPYIRGCIVRELARLLDEFPDYKGWPEMQTFGPELFEEVSQYPLAEGIA